MFLNQFLWRSVCAFMRALDTVDTCVSGNVAPAGKRLCMYYTICLLTPFPVINTKERPAVLYFVFKEVYACVNSRF